MSYKKLVRDNIPAIINAKGQQPITRVLDDKEYFRELIKKLKEEVAEFETNPSVEELADIKEVLIALRLAIGISAGTLEETRRTKANKNGAFKKKLYLEGVQE